MAAGMKDQQKLLHDTGAAQSSRSWLQSLRLLAVDAIAICAGPSQARVICWQGWCHKHQALCYWDVMVEICQPGVPPAPLGGKGPHFGP